MDRFPNAIDGRKNLFIQRYDLVELLTHVIQAFHGRIRIRATEERRQFFRQLDAGNHRDQVEGEIRHLNGSSEIIEFQS
ncbi:hypothetical protein ASG52_08560 [Methylobacterium sp. Leaf456]|nr:hypothetical protein ASG52_08560 [Methylobacterium sp. Leaf456]